MTTTNTIASNRLGEAVAAARQGQKAAARRILLEVTTDNPGSEQAHLWLAAVAESPEEAVAALERVLLLNPGNRQAVNALAVHRLRLSQRATGGNQPAPVAPEKTAPAANPQMRPDPPAKPSSGNGPVPGVQSRPVPGATANTFAPGATASSVAPTNHGTNTLTPVQAPAAPQSQAPVRKAWICPVCEAESDRPKPKCVKCGAIIALEDLNALAENRDGNEEILKRAIQTWQARLTEGPSFEAHLSLARAHCNLNQSALAVKHLQEAVRLRPHDGNVRRVLDTLTSRRLVLAVDDSATVRKFVATSLERKGYRVLAAVDGVQAIAIAAETRPDLVLLDITMPKIDGYEVCRLIRKTPDIKKVPVVMLSGRDGFFDKIKGKVAGSTDYITKPFDVKTLVAVLERYILRDQRTN